MGTIGRQLRGSRALGIPHETLSDILLVLCFNVTGLTLDVFIACEKQAY